MADVLGHMVEDPGTDVVFLYCETVRDPAAFARAADRARSLGKPILVVKVGASDAGSRATSSHTASVAGWNAAYDAFFARHGIIQAVDMEEALTIVAVLLAQPPPQGQRVGVVTVSGGAGAWAAEVTVAVSSRSPADKEMKGLANLANIDAFLSWPAGAAARPVPLLLAPRLE